MSDSSRDRVSEATDDPVGEPADGAGPADTAGDRVGELAERASRQDGAALAELMPLVYDELRRLARGERTFRPAE